MQEVILSKRLASKKWDSERTEENRQKYNDMHRRATREVVKAKQKRQRQKESWLLPEVTVSFEYGFMPRKSTTDRVSAGS